MINNIVSSYYGSGVTTQQDIAYYLSIYVGRDTGIIYNNIITCLLSFFASAVVFRVIGFYASNEKLATIIVSSNHFIHAYCIIL